MGSEYYALGESKKAMVLFEQSLNIAREIGNRQAEGYILGNLGLYYADRSEKLRAIEYYDLALAISKEIKDRRNEGIYLDSLGSIYYDSKEAHKAIEYHDKVLAIFKEIGNIKNEGKALWNKSKALSLLGDLQTSIMLAEEAFELLGVDENPYAEDIRRTLAEWRGKS